MTARHSLGGTLLLLVGTIAAACTATSVGSPAPARSEPTAAASSPAASIPPDFPLGSWTTTITEDDVRAAGFTGAGELAENSGTFTMTLSEDGTWTTAQESSEPLKWPVFQGTWEATGPNTFRQRTTFPSDFAGDVVDFEWKVVDGNLVLVLPNPPDPILPVVMESHPWTPAG